MANVLNCNIVVSELRLYSCYYIHFQINTLGETHELSYPFSYGLNSTTSSTWMALILNNLHVWYAIYKKKKTNFTFDH